MQLRVCPRSWVWALVALSASGKPCWSLQVWCLAVSSSGDFVITGSHDRCACISTLPGHTDRSCRCFRNAQVCVRRLEVLLRSKPTPRPVCRSLRLWERTEEPFFVEEERERRLESLFEADLEARIARLRRCNVYHGHVSGSETIHGFTQGLVHSRLLAVQSGLGVLQAIVVAVLCDVYYA